jgi:hypothetical protein
VSSHHHVASSHLQPTQPTFLPPRPSHTSIQSLHITATSSLSSHLVVVVVVALFQGELKRKNGSGFATRPRPVDGGSHIMRADDDLDGPSCSVPSVSSSSSSSPAQITIRGIGFAVDVATFCF